jgi:hypothetical protein
MDNSTNLSAGDVAVAVANSDLEGTVSGNSFDVGRRASLATGANTIDNGAFDSAAGITVVSQNTGVQSMVQQSVNVQANVNTK